jgi:hypothetical protein
MAQEYRRDCGGAVFCPQCAIWAAESARLARDEARQRPFHLRLLRSGAMHCASGRSRLMRQMRLVTTGNRTFVAGADPTGRACAVTIGSG